MPNNGPWVRAIKANAARECEVTEERLFAARREFLKNGVAAAGAVAGGLFLGGCRSSDTVEAKTPPPPPTAKLDAAPNPKYKLDDPLSDEKDATSYNNFYEFGTDKSEPALNAHTLKPRPWSVRVGGEIAKPGVTMDLDDVLKPHPLEERIYRLRCVEAWSMVVPWLGFPLADFLRRLEPTSKARYVAFKTLNDSQQMPGQKRNVLTWPYREGLRLDEAMHPLALLVVGMYGRVLPNQNGAPLRLVVPWKYGFKSIKSIVSIELVSDEPRTTWNQSAPGEYGFYANVNPAVDHPRWSQATERRLGEFRRRPTLPFNGYAEEVGSLYAGMDLRKLY